MARAIRTFIDTCKNISQKNSWTSRLQTTNSNSHSLSQYRTTLTSSTGQGFRRGTKPEVQNESSRLHTACSCLFQQQNRNHSGNGRQEYSGKRGAVGTGLGVGSALLAFSLPWTKKPDPADDEAAVVAALKVGVLAMQKGNMLASQEAFHNALQLAFDLKELKKIDEKQYLMMQINIYGFMAQTAMKSGDVGNAEKLYKETMRKCLEAGQKEDDDSMIELSVKLATLYAQTNRDEEAEKGFKFCMDTMNKKVEEAGGILEADTNTLALRGISLHNYSRLLMKTKQHKKAIELYKQSLETAKEVYGANHPQTLVVLNELASAYVLCRQFKEGTDLYKEACFRAEQMDNMEESQVAFYYNLGEAEILAKNFEDAKKYCARCLEIAEKLDQPSLIKVAKQCMKDVKEVQAKETKKTST